METEVTRSASAGQKAEGRTDGLTTDRVVASQSLGTPAAHLQDRWLLIARAVWPLMAILTVGMFLASLPARYMQLLNPSGDVRVGLALPVLDPAELSTSPQFYASYNLALEVLYALLFFAVALVIFWRVRNDRMALFASFVLLTFGTASTPTMQALAEPQTAWYMLPTTLGVVAELSIGAFIFLFPDGRFAPRWTLWPFVLWAAHYSLNLFPTSPFYPEKWPPVLHSLLWLVVAVSAAFSLVYKYRHVLGPVQREQTRWVVFGMVVGVLGAVASSLPTMLLGPPRHLGHPWSVFHELVHVPLLYSFLALIPLTIGISIVHYRLWDIDIIINRTLVYLPLTGILAGLYSASMVLFQKLSVAITGERSDAAVVLTTLVIASVFTPVKEKVQTVVDKSYKQARDPARKLKMFNKQMESFIEMIDVQELMRRALDEVVDAFGAKYGAIYLYLDPGLTQNKQRGQARQVRLVHTSDQWPDHDNARDADNAENSRWISVPLRSNGNDLGLLRLGPNLDGLAHSPQDWDSLQRTAELLARTVVLTRRLHKRWE